MQMMEVERIGFDLTHSGFCYYSNPPDETEYEYSGSEEEDEERDVGEPRSVSSHVG